MPGSIAHKPVGGSSGDPPKPYGQLPSNGLSSGDAPTNAGGHPDAQRCQLRQPIRLGIRAAIQLCEHCAVAEEEPANIVDLRVGRHPNQVDSITVVIMTTGYSYSPPNLLYLPDPTPYEQLL